MQKIYQIIKKNQPSSIGLSIYLFLTLSNLPDDNNFIMNYCSLFIILRWLRVKQRHQHKLTEKEMLI